MLLKNSLNQERSNRSVLGIGLMLLGLALYTISDGLIKYFVGTYSVHQTSFLRALTRLIPLLLAALATGRIKSIFKTEQPSNHIIRLAVNLAYTYAFIYTFSMGSLTAIYTFGYTSPLFMILLAAPLLKEKISLDKWGAVFIGLIGVFIATRPNSTAIEWTAIIVLLASFLGALNKILMRKLTATEHSLSIAIYPNIVMIVVMSPFILFTWTAMPFEHWLLFGVMGILTAGGQYAIAEALRLTQVPTLASIDYSTFFWVIALDFFCWNQIPDRYTLIGAAIIVGSNLYILYKTRKAPEILQKANASDLPM